jgi:peptidoglycan/xylan/chitin deacetylase (PgdA/CDA1 family)
MTSPRDIALHILRALGGFRVAQFLTRRRLRILCYHGFSTGDEHEVTPHMFMRAETFERRMRALQRRGIPVIPLDEAVRRLAAGEIHHGETVITLDDGWTSNLTIGAPILEKYGFPACIYVTTEHLDAGTEVFNVALHYMICRSPRRELKLEGLHPRLDGTYDLRTDPDSVTVTLIKAAEQAFPVLADRQQLLRPIASALDMDLAEVLRNERFRLMTGEELLELETRGFDIELHTHSHRLPDRDFESMANEVERNREALRSILAKEKSHFCFPSGQYKPQHPEWLRRLGITSGTTCDPGLNGPGAEVMLLKRYLDADHVSDIAFEAEVSGVRELARGARAMLNAPPILRRRIGPVERA